MLHEKQSRRGGLTCGGGNDNDSDNNHRQQAFTHDLVD